MSIRDFQASFTDVAAGTAWSFFGAAGTYIAPNSIDTAPLGSYLTAFSANDTQLSGNVNTYRDMGGGDPMWVVIDITQTVNTLTTVDFQLITSASSTLSSPTVMLDFTAIAIATLVKGYRLVGKLPRSTAWLEWIGLQAVTAGSTGTTGAAVAWLAKDIDAVDLGAAAGYSIK